MYRCPRCGKKGVDYEDSLSTCIICGWTDDPVQRKNPDEDGGANSLSLDDYRKQYEADRKAAKIKISGKKKQKRRKR